MPRTIIAPKSIPPVNVGQYNCSNLNSALYRTALSVSSLDHRVDSLEFNIVLSIKAANQSGKSRVQSDGGYRSPRPNGLFAGSLTIKIAPQS